MLSVDLANTPVLTSFAPIESLDWRVFVEQPAGTAYEKLNAWVRNTQLLLLAGLLLSAVGALWLARGMVRPIRTLDEGARRIGAGDLDQQIVVRTGDELEGLADQFNRMTAQLRESYAGLERKVDERTRELTDSLEQQTAISEILRVISGSPTDVRPMLDAIAERALRLCDAAEAGILLRRGRQASLCDRLRHDAVFEKGELLALTRKLVVGRSIIDRVTLHYADLVPLLDTEYPDARAHQERFGFRAILTVPLMREDTRDRRDHPLASRGRGLHRQAGRAGQDVRGPGGARDRERAPLQRDQGSAGAADGDSEDPGGDLELADRCAAGVRRDRRARDAAVRCDRSAARYLFDGELVHLVAFHGAYAGSVRQRCDALPDEAADAARRRPRRARNACRSRFPTCWPTPITS